MECCLLTGLIIPNWETNTTLESRLSHLNLFPLIRKCDDCVPYATIKATLSQGPVRTTDGDSSQVVVVFDMYDVMEEQERLSELMTELASEGPKWSANACSLEWCGGRLTGATAAVSGDLLKATVSIRWNGS